MLSLPAGFQVVITGDGSPSLLSELEAQPEIMHHRGGAWSETDYVYGHTLRQWLASPAAQTTTVAQVCSLGLGLGYNELFTVHEWWRRRGELDSLQLVSFESQAFLRENFLAWVLGEKPSVLARLYDEIAAKFNSKISLREHLATLLRRGQWQLHGAMDLTEWQGSAHVYLWDAFSRKASPQLWDEELLRATFARAPVAAPVVLGTYACLGALKRALKDNGFTVEVREGFQGKRNCTFASRGLF